jgi:hypothetical protein
MKRNSIFVFLLASVLLFSCSAEQKLKRRLTGDWNITSYQEQNVDGEDGTSADIGTITFNRNGTGKRNLSGISWRRNFSERGDFRWQNSASTVTIFDKSSIFAKSWIITVNKKKRQQWKSTDRGNVQTVELKR